jgi:hypothetical protein
MFQEESMRISEGEMHRQFVVYREHLAGFFRHYLSKRKLSRSHVWRPMKLCSRGKVLGLAVIRHDRFTGVLEADVCLTDNPSHLEAYAGSMAMIASLLCDAFKWGGKMEIHFTGNVFNGTVPPFIQEFAREKGIELSCVEQGAILPSEARALFLEVTEFSSLAKAKLIALHKEKKVTVERVCFMVQSGVYTREEIESLLLSHPHPETAILCTYRPEVWLLYRLDLHYIRMAVLGGHLDRKLAFRERISLDGQTVHGVVDDLCVDIRFDPQFLAKIYVSNQDLIVPWLAFSEPKELTIPAGERMVVMLLARQLNEFRLWHRLGNFPDAKTAADMVRVYKSENEKTHCFVLVPRDFEEIPLEERRDMLCLWHKAGIEVLLCPQTFRRLDIEAFERLEGVRWLRQV